MAAPGRPYAFQGCSNLFTSVQLESRSVSWDGHPLACTWRVDGREVGSGRLLRTVLTGRGVSKPVELTVTESNADAYRK